MKNKHLHVYILVVLLILGICSVRLHVIIPLAKNTSATHPDFIIDKNGVLLSYHGVSADVVIPDNVTSIGIKAFSGCTSLKNVTIPYGVTSIGIKAFSGCTNLKNIIIPDSVTSIEANAFLHCDRLSALAVPSSLEQIQYSSGSFWGCKNLKILRMQVVNGSKIPIKITLSEGADMRKPKITSNHKKIAVVTRPCYNTDAIGETSAIVTVTARQPGKAQITFQRINRNNHKKISKLKLVIVPIS